MLQQAYGNEALSRTQCFELHRYIKSERTFLEDDEQCRRLAVDPGNVILRIENSSLSVR